MAGPSNVVHQQEPPRQHTSASNQPQRILPRRGPPRELSHKQVPPEQIPPLQARSDTSLSQQRLVHDLDSDLEDWEDEDTSDSSNDGDYDTCHSPQHQGQDAHEEQDLHQQYDQDRELQALDRFMETMNGIQLAVKNGMGMIDTRLSESSNLLATWTESLKSYSRERDSDRIELSSQEPEGSNQGTGYLDLIHNRLGAIEKEHEEHRHLYEQLDHYVKKHIHKLRGDQQAMEERVQELEQRLEQKLEQLKKEQEQHRQYALQQQLQQQMHQMQQQMLQLVLQQQQQQQPQQQNGSGSGKSRVNGTVRIDLDGEDEVDT